MSIPPIIAPDGTPSCPQGYGLSPDGTQCLPITPPISVDVAGVSQAEIDPSQFARQAAGGYKSSGILADLATFLWTWIPRHMSTVISVASNVFDLFLTGLAQFFFAAQGQRNAGYFKLVAALMTDLTGIVVDGDTMFADFNRGGRLHAMRDLGGGLINALASEFAGVEQTSAGDAWNVTPGTGIGGLPAVPLTPAGGVDAARAMMGFMTSFAVREGNTDMFADYLPYGIGRWFKDFAEDFSKSVGLGRLGRVLFRPLMQIMGATPLTWALNMQYRPHLLSVPEVLRAHGLGIFSQAERDNELALLGYSDQRIQAVLADVGKYPTVGDWRILLANQKISSDDFTARMLGDGYTPQATIDIPAALDLDPARTVTLRYVEHYVTQFLEGHITQDAVRAFLDNLAAQLSTGKVPLTSGEVAGLRSLVDAIIAAGPIARPRHLSFAQLQLAYIDGTITLDELDQHLTLLGYNPDDVTILTLETLIKAKDKAAAAAKKAGKGKTGTPTPASQLATPGA